MLESDIAFTFKRHIMEIPPRFGTTVTGKSRFARPELEAELDNRMRSGNGARMFGLRRIGKSTEAMAYRDRAASASPAPILIELDAQGFTSEAQLLLDILQALPIKGWRERITTAIAGNNAIAQVARDVLQKVVGRNATTDIQAYFLPIMQSIESVISSDDAIVIIIDEFPWLCRSILEADPTGGRGRVDVLLAVLRRWRNKGVRMLLLGSIGMTALGRLHRLDLNHLNDIAPFDVPPLTRDQAEAMVQALALGGVVQAWTAAHTCAMLDETVALYPAIIQQAFQTLSIGQHAAQLGNIAEIFADKIRPDLDAGFYAQFDTRLKHYRELPAPLPALLHLLLPAVMDQAGQSQPYPALRNAASTASTDDADLGDALAILREDGFLRLRAPRNAPQQWLAASSLVSAWWTQRRGGRQ